MIFSRVANDVWHIDAYSYRFVNYFNYKSRMRVGVTQRSCWLDYLPIQNSAKISSADLRQQLAGNAPESARVAKRKSSANNANSVPAGEMKRQCCRCILKSRAVARVQERLVARRQQARGVLGQHVQQLRDTLRSGRTTAAPRGRRRRSVAVALRSHLLRHWHRGIIDHGKRLAVQVRPYRAIEHDQAQIRACARARARRTPSASMMSAASRRPAVSAGSPDSRQGRDAPRARRGWSPAAASRSPHHAGRAD